MNKSLCVIALLLIAGFGMNQWFAKTHADAVLTTIDEHAERNTERTIQAITASASTEISEQFTRERKIRDQEFDKLVSAVDLAASNAVAEQFQREREADRLAEQQQRAQLLAATYIAEGLQLASTARMAVIEYYQVNDRLPRSNREAGLPAPTEFSTNALTSLVISFDGEIILNYNKKSGVHRGMIRLTPDTSLPQSVRWQCRSRNIRKIGEIAPNCAFDPSA